jgi:hypothetical protein
MLVLQSSIVFGFNIYFLFLIWIVRNLFRCGVMWQVCNLYVLIPNSFVQDSDEGPKFVAAVQLL